MSLVEVKAVSNSPTHLSFRLRRTGREACSCDGAYSFILPFATVTTLNLTSALVSPECAPAWQLLLPGLMAGTCGMALYKAIKLGLKHYRRETKQPLPECFN